MAWEYDAGSEQWREIADKGAHPLAGKSYADLKASGQWDLSNPQLLSYLDSLSNMGSSTARKLGAVGDWRTNPAAASQMFTRLGLSTHDFPTGMGYLEKVTNQFGDMLSPEYLKAVDQARSGMVNAQQSDNGLGGIVDTGVDFVKDWGKEFVVPAALTYLGVNALGGALGGAAGAEGAASTGGTAAGSGTALGSGLTPGATGAAGLTPGAAGAAGVTAAAPVGTSLAPGYFAAETIAPAVGAGSFGGTSGASGGGSALAPSGTGAPGGGGVLSTIASGLPGVLGAVASSQQAGDYKDLARDYMAVGAPARARFEASYAPGFSMEDDPGYKEALEQAAKATLHGLSVGGNPAGSPNAWAQSLTDLYKNHSYRALQDYRNQNASAGGMGALTQAAPGAAGSAIASQGNVFNALGAAANDIFNPPKSLTQILREIRAAGM
jgi:hypothetical protein